MRKVLSIILTVLVALYIPMAALMVVTSGPVSQFLMEDALKQTTADEEERASLVEVGMAVRDFSFGNDDANMPTGEDYLTAITSDAVSHLLDVRTVFLFVEYLSIGILLLLILLMTIAVRRFSARALVKPLIIGGALPFAAALILGIYVAIDFGVFFSWMHGLFFADGTWLFPADSLLIRSLPYGFWISCAVMWAVFMVLLCAVCIVVGIFLERRARRLDAQTHPAQTTTKKR